MKNPSTTSDGRSPRLVLAALALVALLALFTLLALAPANAQPLPAIGLSSAGAQLHQEAGSYPHSPGPADYFGRAIAVGDFNDDGFSDLASGIPGNDCDFAVWDCGAVQVRFGWAVGPLGGFLTLDPNGVGPNGELPPEPARADDRYGETLAVGDFQNDGYDDLVVGLPNNANFSANGTSSRSGAIQIHYGLHGSIGSLQWVAEHVLWKGHVGDGDAVPGAALSGDRFGSALAVGDFNGDGHDDLAVGDPYDECQNVGDGLCSGVSRGVGGVHVAHGHVGGLVPFEGFEMRLGLEGLPDSPEDRDQFGFALAVGDFQNDGFDDLAIGVPGEDGVGAVLVVYGSPNSLIFAHHVYFGLGDLNDTAQTGSRFGEVLATGDFDDDGFDDLAVGVPKHDGDGAGLTDAGFVSVVYGSPAGLSVARSDGLSEDLLFGVPNSEAFDNFGSALAAGDFDDDGVEDLAIGILGENGTHSNIGGAAVLLGRAQQNLAGGTVRRLFPRGVPGTSGYDAAGMIPDGQIGDPFWGFALAAGDFDGNGFEDLAIGSPARNAPTESGHLVDSGAVAVLFGQLFIDGFEIGSGREWSSSAP